MSSAKSGIKIFSLCLHIRKYLSDTFYRAKPVTERERSGREVVHCGVMGCTIKLYTEMRG